MIAIYARQSLDKKDSISIDSQIEACKRLHPDEDYEVFQDKGYSGSNTQRPAFQELLCRIKEKDFTSVVVYRLDRISRSLLDFTQVYTELKTHGVEFESVNEKFETKTPMGEAMLNIIMVFAELERKTIQQRISDNYSARGERGMYLGGPPPYGFDKVPSTLNSKKTSKLTANKDADTIIKIFNMYAESDCSLGDIVKMLTKDNVVSPTDKGWDSSRISLILHNPVYVKADAEIYNYYKNVKKCIVTNDVTDFIGTNGCFLYGKRTGNERKYTNLENHHVSIALHEGIIDSATFLACQRKLANNRQIGNSGKGTITWLTGLAKCGCCEYSLRFVAYCKNSSERLAYCSGKSNKHICDGLGEGKVFLHDIEAAVEEQLLLHLAAQRDKILVNDEVKIDNSVNIKLQQTQERIEALLDRLENTDFNEQAQAIITQRLNKLAAEQRELQHQLNTSYRPMNRSKIYRMYDLVDRWHELSLEEKKSVAKACIKRVLVTDKEIRIEFLHFLSEE